MLQCRHLIALVLAGIALVFFVLSSSQPRDQLRVTKVAAAASSAADTYIDDVKDFTRYAGNCTDKTSAHRYQHLYGRVLAPYRHPSALRVQKAAGTLKMLEIGLGCNMPVCVAGGFRLFQKYLPNVVYHVFEFQMELCRTRYGVANLTGVEIDYLEAHSCQGDSGNKTDLLACAHRFGPFDVIVDDGSHYPHHVRNAFETLFPSSYLRSGGAYVIEDLQVGYIDWVYGGGLKAQTKRTTMPQYIMELLQLKLAVNPHTLQMAGKIYPPLMHAPKSEEIARLTSVMVCSAESCAFFKNEDDV